MNNPFSSASVLKWGSGGKSSSLSLFLSRFSFFRVSQNAVKYHRSDVTTIKIYVEEKNWKACIFVEDNGIGFDEKYLDKIFQPFQRLHGKHEYPGTGIGLAICRKIVERHAGTITARSTPGKGSTFIVTLPVSFNRS